MLTKGVWCPVCDGLCRATVAVETNSGPADRRYMMKRILVLAVFAVLVAVPVASAGKSFTSGVTVSGPLDPVTLQPVSPAYGATVVFDVEGITAADNAFFNVTCDQKGTFLHVYSNGENLSASGISSQYTLADRGAFPPFWAAWPAGTAASCTAKVSVQLNNNHKVVASVDFGVAAS